MPTFPGNFGVLALHPGILESNAFMFLSQNSGNSGLLDAYLRLHDGSTVPLYTIKDTTSFLHGSGTPGTGVGMSGDFYYDYFNYRFFGPKTSVWPAGASISGVPGGGKDGQVFAWQGVDERGWDYPRNILKTYKNLSLDSRDLNRRRKILSKNNGTTHSALPGTLGRGVAFCQGTGSIFIVDGQNSTPALYEFTLSGDYIRKITLSGFVDVQSIDWMYASTFVICERGQTSTINEISVIQIPYSTEDDTLIVKGADNWIHTIETNIGSTSYTDIEGSIFRGISGVTYNPYNDNFYFCNGRPHLGQWSVWELKNDISATPVELFDLSPLQPDSKDEVGDIAYNRETGTFYIAFDDVLINVDFSGNLLEESLNPYQIGGISFNKDSSQMFLTMKLISSPRLFVESFLGKTSCYNGYNGYTETFANDKVYLGVARIANEGCTSFPNPETVFTNVSSSNDFYLFKSTYNSNVSIATASLSANQKYRIKAYGELNTSGALFHSNCIFKAGAEERLVSFFSGVLPSGENQAWSMECNLHFYNSGVIVPMVSHQQFICGSQVYSSVGNSSFDKGLGELWQPMLNFSSSTGQVDMKIYSVSLYKD